MPVHDWTRVAAGIFHEFHLDWIFTIKQALNQGVLPPDYYALAEQVSGGLHPDVLTLGKGRPADSTSGNNGPSGTSSNGGIAVAVALSAHALYRLDGIGSVFAQTQSHCHSPR